MLILPVRTETALGAPPLNADLLPSRGEALLVATYRASGGHAVLHANTTRKVRQVYQSVPGKR